MEVSLRTLTPIWTGDSEGVSKSLRETGLIGSLRWWYEGLMRALGVCVCDPTDGGCEYSSDTKLEKVCAVCRLFGCTGWARKFRLLGEGLKPEPWSVAVGRDVFSMHQGWLGRIYLKDKPQPQVLWGPQFRLQFMPRLGTGDGVADEELAAHLGPLLRLVERWGALGAKTQNGYGVIKLESGLGGGAWPPTGKAPANGSQPGLFSLREFFSINFAIRDPGEYRAARRLGAAKTGYDSLVIPCAYDIRYKSRTEDWRTGAGESFGLRPWLKGRFERRLGAGLADLLGAPARSKDRRASRIHVSHLYRESASDSQYRLRIWGAVPSSLGVRPEAVADAITEFICAPKGMFPGSRVTGRATWQELKGGA